MGLYEDLLATASDADVIDACPGLHWTGVRLRRAGVDRCGLASTLRPVSQPSRQDSPGVLDVGEIASLGGRALAERVPRGGVDSSLGFAALQALIPLDPERWVEGNADRPLARRAAGRRVALVGRFHFAPALRPTAKSLAVLELEPRQDELPADQAADILPRSDLIVITGMALVNRTLEGLLSLCPAGSDVALVGPSVPLSRVLFDYGVSLLCGAIVERPDAVMAGIRQGADFHQIHRLGARLVTYER